MKGIALTKEFVADHQRRHGFATAPPASQKVAEPAVKLPKPRQNRTEAEYGLILEAQKRRGEIVDYRPFGIRLEWGCDPRTGKPMVYSPDWFVLDYMADSLAAGIRLIEIKGGFARPKDVIRFKGCRAEWPMFRFELHQKTKEGWRRIA